MSKRETLRCKICDGMVWTCGICDEQAVKHAAAHHFRYVHKRSISPRLRIIQAFEAGAKWKEQRSEAAYRRTLALAASGSND